MGNLVLGPALIDRRPSTGEADPGAQLYLWGVARLGLSRGQYRNTFAVRVIIYGFVAIAARGYLAGFRLRIIVARASTAQRMRQLHRGADRDVDGPILSRHALLCFAAGMGLGVGGDLLLCGGDDRKREHGDRATGSVNARSCVGTKKLP